MRSPTIHREWVDWTRPLIPAAARWLLDHGRTSREAADSNDPGTCDLHDIICVTPGKRGGRVLLESLLRECRTEKLHLDPPQCITPGLLPDMLGKIALDPENIQPVASNDDACMAWAQALRASDPKSLRPLISHLPDSDDFLGWYSLAQLVQQLDETLAGGMLSFAQVAEKAGRLELLSEHDRWQALNALRETYLSVLRHVNLRDPHQSRLEALSADAHSRDGTRSGVAHVVLIGVVELNALQREALACASEATALIHASETLAAAFDAFGCVIPERWSERTIELSEAQIIIADRPDDQAQAVLEQLAERANKPVDSITIGLGDDAFGEPLERAAQWADVGIHRAESRTLAHSGAYRLLDAVAEWIREQRFAAFAALLRHPDMERRLSECFAADNEDESLAVRDWISLLDRYFTDHLHTRLTSPWLGDPARKKRLKRMHDEVRSITAPLLAAPPSRRLAEWCEPVLSVLRNVYDRLLSDDDGESRGINQMRDACIAIRDRLAELTTIVESLQPKCDACTAVRLLLGSCASAALPLPLREDEIEALGWLELHLDAAPSLIVMGVNDGSVPAAASADAFLPDALKAALGLPCNASRYARDAYLLEAIARSRESLTLIAGRRGMDGEPLTPSRLLLACDPEQLPTRVLRLSDESQALRRPVPIGAPPAREACEFTIFSPPPGPVTLDRMRVTAFKEYLKCPLRWWLKNIAKIKLVSDQVSELDAMAFGNLAHEVLERFGRDETLRDSADAPDIAAWLENALAQIALERFGAHPPPAVRVQLDRLKRRMDGFAQFQAAHRSEGWIIHECELKLESCKLDIPGEEPIIITAKIDRIDRHEQSGAYRIIDYKTGDSGETPFQTHHGRKTYKKDCWVDLQLPLYRHLAAQVGFDGDVQLGYIVLPKEAERVAFLPAEWDREQLDEAIEKARCVVMQIRAGNFEMGEGGLYDEFENICQTNVLGRAANEAEVEA